MSAQAADHPEPAEPYEIIHLGGEAAAIVPLADLRRLRAVTGETRMACAPSAQPSAP
jgi:hypothetical protein